MAGDSPSERKPNLAFVLARASIFGTAVAGTFLVLLPWLLLRMSTARWNLGLAPRVIGVVLMALGYLVAVWCAIGFVVEGWGTPAPYDPPRRLVTGHLYERVRNPIYVGGTIILLGEVLVFRSPALLAFAAAMWLIWHLVVVLYEEPALRRRFGAAYEDYRRRVPRWIPRLW